ncbi:MAG: response regulator [Ignavibacteriales bacterium]|nr:response regulator [Ignavibacteriales bacterium]MCB9219589.1 response regulator [Ignavibacteriales bacterium]MCB9257809.1 response regulator [Ignavibacteriales bacterium]
MGQALKVIKFESDEKSENTKSFKKRYKSKISSELVPLTIAATFTAILGVISLILEVKFYFQFRYEIYLARLIPTIVSFLTLIVLQTKFGKKQNKVITHIYLLSILSSLSFVVYHLPSLYIYNMIAAVLFMLTLSLFLYWGTVNQTIAAGYFLLIFGISAVTNNLLLDSGMNLYLFITTSFLMLVISIVASHLRATNKTLNKSFKSANHQEESEDSNLYKDFFEESVTPFFLINLHGELQNCNSAFKEIIEVQNDADLNEFNFFNDFLKNDNVKNHIVKKIESKGKVENYRIKVAKKDKVDVYLMDCRGKSIDEEIHLEGSFREITAQYLKDKAIISELETLKQSKKQNNNVIPSISNESNKKSNVISKMGHELRTPMNSVLGFLTLIENGLFENEDELKEFSHSAKLSAESLLGLINDVVEISKIQEGLVDIVNTEFNIRDEIEKLTSSLSPHTELKGLNLTYDIEENIPERIIADQGKYLQILTNLLRNAINLTETGSVKLSIRKKYISPGKEKIITSVEDTSEGISNSELEKILSDNNYIKDKDSRITSGVLHIMICKELLSLLDGNLSASSEIGMGTKFTFTIDLESGKVEEDEVTDDGIIKRVNYKVKPKLLLVEDNPISRKVEQKLLQEAGYDVDCVDNATTAIENIKKGTYDLVLMDIELKDMNGLEATKIVRQLSDGNGEIPIIAVTAHSSMKDREKCLLAGMNDYISKPININFLKMTIDQWLNAAKVN